MDWVAAKGNGSTAAEATASPKEDPIEQNLINGTYDAGDEQSLLMAPKEITLAGKKNIVSVYRVTSEVNDGVKYKLEDFQRSGKARAVYISTDDRRICDASAIKTKFYCEQRAAKATAHKCTNGIAFRLTKVENSIGRCF